jgi:hypothetical protein
VKLRLSRYSTQTYVIFNKQEKKRSKKQLTVAAAAELSCSAAKAA